MSRSITGMIITGVLIAIFGIILATAVNEMIQGVNTTKIGWILSIGGGLLALIGVVLAFTVGRSRRRTEVDLG